MIYFSSKFQINQQIKKEIDPCFDGKIQLFVTDKYRRRDDLH